MSPVRCEKEVAGRYKAPPPSTARPHGGEGAGGGQSGAAGVVVEVAEAAAEDVAVAARFVAAEGEVGEAAGGYRVELRRER